MTVRLAIVVPCYNEEEVLPETNRRLLALLANLNALKPWLPPPVFHARRFLNNS